MARDEETKRRRATYTVMQVDKRIGQRQTEILFTSWLMNRITTSVICLVSCSAHAKGAEKLGAEVQFGHLSFCPIFVLFSFSHRWNIRRI